MYGIQTHHLKSLPLLTDADVFKEIDNIFTFDMFVENFFQDEPSWIVKTPHS